MRERNGGSNVLEKVNEGGPLVDKGQFHRPEVGLDIVQRLNQRMHRTDARVKGRSSPTQCSYIDEGNQPREPVHA